MKRVYMDANATTPLKFETVLISSAAATAFGSNVPDSVWGICASPKIESAIGGSFSAKSSHAANVVASDIPVNCHAKGDNSTVNSG